MLVQLYIYKRSLNELVIDLIRIFRTISSAHERVLLGLA